MDGSGRRLFILGHLLIGKTRLQHPHRVARRRLRLSAFDFFGLLRRLVERGAVQKNRGDVAVPSGEPAERILARDADLVIVGHQEVGNRPEDIDPFFVWDPLQLFSFDDRHRSGKIGRRTLRLGDNDVAEIDLSFPGRSPFGRFGGVISI